MATPSREVAFPHLERCEVHEAEECPKCNVSVLLPNVYVPSAPHIGMDDDEVENTPFLYSDRAPEDWVISGPLGESGHGRGRHFETWRHAENWARKFYGRRYKGRLPDEPNSGGRWAFLVRGPRGATNVGGHPSDN